MNADQDIDATPIYVCSTCGRTVRDEAPDCCPICGTASDQFEVY
ncbi:MAG: rubredoxin-like domain-containing protein [Armatimonadota bacterium]